MIFPRNTTAPLFVRNLMRKMFTQDYLSITTVLQMDFKQRTAIIGIYEFYFIWNT